MDELERSLLADPLLQDITPDTSLDELAVLRAKERGEALSLQLRLFDGSHLDVLVARDATVRTLKLAVQRAVCSDYAARHGGQRRRLSWKTVWKNWSLLYEGRKLTDNDTQLLTLGVDGSCVIAFHSLRNDRIKDRRATKRERDNARTTAAVARAKAKAFTRRRR